MRRRLVLLALAGALLRPAAAGAQLVSPGPLAKAHAKLEGLASCTACHAAGEGLSEEKCLACHTDVAARVRAGKGLHGRMQEGERACEGCHPDHRGADAPLVSFATATFDHRKTGWRLEGAHASLECARCHEPRRIVDPAVRSRVAKQPGVTTFLGLGTRCEECHFDEHRGQLGKRCETCHVEKSWKPAPRFSHDRFALAGGHRNVACEKCHAAEPAPSDAFPPPVSATMTRFTPVKHDDCADCHRDPHGGRFEGSCSGCHVVEDWKKTRAAATGGGFHDQTRYPLRGAHEKVACRSCHGPLPGKPKKLRGLAFDRCGRCHEDAHLGALGAAPDCARCHDVEGFSPARYELTDHEKSRYPLEGAHAAVACQACHPVDEGLLRRARREVGKAAARRARLFSAVVLHPPGDRSRCDGCHRDPHQGQLTAGGKRCDGCHRTSSFREVAIDHDRDTSWPLTGAHRKAACAGCHVAPAPGRAVVYRGTPADCASCHEDVHRGQLTSTASTASAGAGCARCHETERFAPSRFRHDDPRFTSFALDGRHADLACEKCHRSVEGVARYKPLPRACGGCHVDPHDGGMDRYLASAGAGRCEACHQPAGWAPLDFPHERTRFPLVGAHASAACAACHAAGLEVKLSGECASCHRDPHAGELGARCAGCHDERGWTGGVGPEAHRRTRFPLTGRHATLPCEECHGEARERRFSRAAAACADCHARDVQRAALTSIDHVKAGFDDSCERCHTPMSFENATFAEHDGCFEITRGPHRAVGCKECHSDVAAAATRSRDGACATRNAACTSCHEHSCDRTDRRHGDVPGYQCKERKCYECHRLSTE